MAGHRQSAAMRSRGFDALRLRITVIAAHPFLVAHDAVSHADHHAAESRLRAPTPAQVMLLSPLPSFLFYRTPVQHACRLPLQTCDSRAVLNRHRTHPTLGYRAESQRLHPDGPRRVSTHVDQRSLDRQTLLGTRRQSDLQPCPGQIRSGSGGTREQATPHGAMNHYAGCDTQAVMTRARRTTFGWRRSTPSQHCSNRGS